MTLDPADRASRLQLRLSPKFPANPKEILVAIFCFQVPSHHLFRKTFELGGSLMLLPRRRIALVSATENFREEAVAYFAASGFEPFEATDAKQLFGILSETSCELAVVQLELPDMDEFTLVKELKSKNIRCIVVADKSDVADRVLALEFGADDYLSPSVDRRELLARVRVVLRRGDPASQGSPASDQSQDKPLKARLPASGLKFERLQRQLLDPNGRIIPLTTAEYNLLTSLADHTNVSLSRERLYELVYNRRWSVYDRTLDTLVAKLRRKIERNPEYPELIKTVHGSGYIFTGIDFTS